MTDTVEAKEAVALASRVRDGLGVRERALVAVMHKIVIAAWHMQSWGVSP
ncbi:hypothetical protein [Streptomyces collinus]|nr:hypothetical protein [Streptomyces collinus]UJA11026.1 hypothetical protein HGI10_50010 [Streptomyces collinus]UJA14110.1 hypothetical protein HGI09_14110 [Streptomyces collinus]